MYKKKCDSKKDKALKEYKNTKYFQNKIKELKQNLYYKQVLTDIIFQTSSDELIITDENFNITLRNYKLNLTQQRNIFNFVDFIKGLSDIEMAEKVLEFKQKSETQLCIVLTKTNTNPELPISVNISKIFDKSNNCCGFFVIIKDIGSQIAANVLTENFISTLTHDIKAPVLAQINALKILLRLPEFAQKEIILELYNSCLFINMITENLLAKYKNSFNSSDSSFVYCNFVAIVTKSINDLNYFIEQKQHNVEFKILSEEINIVSAVKSEMEMLVKNLLLNAINNSFAKGKIKIILGNFGNGIKIIVRDFGYGVTSQEVKSIFNEYTNSANRYQKPAHNLCLQICRQIVGAYNGNIKIKSKAGKGMLVGITLPSLFIKKNSLKNKKEFILQKLV